MFDDLNRELMHLRAKLKLQSRLRNQLSGVRRSLIQAESKWRDLEALLQAEERDVEKLEGLSLTALFYTILGGKDQQLEKERQERLAAKLKYDECGQARAAMHREISELELRIRNLGNLERQYANLIAEKEHLIATTPNPVFKEYFELSEQLTDLRSNIKELSEAVDAGKAVLKALRNAIKSLKSAQSWGTWDLWGGGLIATNLKHSRIDEARFWIAQVQRLLHRFQVELTDVNISKGRKLELEISSFETFSDYFFDCLITDWIVQQKIDHSLRNAEQMLDRVHNLVVEMQARLGGVTARVNAVMTEKRELIESA
ncbi:MAG TPA: hypothetical protein VJ302_17240 [Blastocatellia bacterium]|nr:hypothetical protein [Blastocatellia bacterium]